MDEKELSTCKKCGKEFKDHISLTRHISKNNGKDDHPKTVKEYYDTYLLKEGEGKCIVCGNPTIFNRINIGYYKTCSNKCAQLNPETRKKIEATSLDLYRVKHPLQNIDVKNKMLNTWDNKTNNELNTIQQKQIDTNNSKIGYDYPTQSPVVLKKRADNFFKKYGVTSPMHLDNIKKKLSKVLTERSKDEIIERLNNLNIEVLEYTKSTDYCKLKCNKCSTEFYQRPNRILDPRRVNSCPECSLKAISNLQLDLYKYIKSKIDSKELILNDRSFLHPLEADILCHTQKFVIELNGIVWHSSSEVIDRDFRKVTEVINKGYKFLSIFDYDWIDNNEESKNKVDEFLEMTYDQYCLNKHRFISFDLDPEMIMMNRTEIRTKHNYKVPSTNVVEISKEIKDSRSINYQTLVSSYIPDPIISKSNIYKEIEEFLSNSNIQYKLPDDLFFINETLILFPVCIEELSTINEEYFYNSKKLKKYYSSLLIDNPTFKKVVVLFSDEWVYKNEISKSRIINNSDLIVTKIFARKCVVKEVDYTVKNEFLDKYHIQGRDSSKVKLGLYTKDNELVSIMTFSRGSVSKGAKQSEKIFELNRFCSKNNYLVIGGASKLLFYFENIYKPEEIYSYADKRWSDGNLYKTLGFEYNSETEPNYWYIINKRRLHRFNFRKDQLKKYSNYNDNKTEQEIMC